jgi:hypothetical protein
LVGSGGTDRSTARRFTDGGRESGNIIGIRFYKGLGNNGIHIGLLYTSSGTLLAPATFTGETAFGWRQMNFSTPVAITANTVAATPRCDCSCHGGASTRSFQTSRMKKAPDAAL